MYSFLINTLFSNEMTASDLLFGNFAKNIKDTEIPTFLPPLPHATGYSFKDVSQLGPCLPECLQSVALCCFH